MRPRLYAVTISARCRSGPPKPRRELVSVAENHSTSEMTLGWLRDAVPAPPVYPSLWYKGRRRLRKWPLTHAARRTAGQISCTSACQWGNLILILSQLGSHAAGRPDMSQWLIDVMLCVSVCVLCVWVPRRRRTKGQRRACVRIVGSSSKTLNQPVCQPAARVSHGSRFSCATEWRWQRWAMIAISVKTN